MNIENCQNLIFAVLHFPLPTSLGRIWRWQELLYANSYKMQYIYLFSSYRQLSVLPVNEHNPRLLIIQRHADFLLHALLL